MTRREMLELASRLHRDQSTEFFEGANKAFDASAAVGDGGDHERAQSLALHALHGTILSAAHLICLTLSALHLGTADPDWLDKEIGDPPRMN